MNHPYSYKIDILNTKLSDYERTNKLEKLEEAYQLVSELRKEIGSTIHLYKQNNPEIKNNK